MPDEIVTRKCTKCQTHKGISFYAPCQWRKPYAPTCMVCTPKSTKQKTQPLYFGLQRQMHTL
jgi:hypothetical protein